MVTQTTPTRKHQFTLRALLVGTTICATALAALWYSLEPIRRETRAMAEIQRAADSEVDPDGLMSAGCIANYLPPETPYARAVCWLGRAPGRVWALSVDGDAPAQEFLRRIDSFSELTELDIRSAVADADVARLRKLHRLKALQIYESGIQGEGLASLAELPTLTFLGVSSEQLDESALSGVSHCESLEYLALGFDRSHSIDARAYSNLQKLPRLKKLYISGGISDEAMPELIALRALRSLQIFDSGLSDQGIEHLRGNPSIEKLWLCDLPGVTDESIDVLVSMTALKELYVQDTKVSAAGLKSLNVARPGIDLSPEELQH